MNTYVIPYHVPTDLMEAQGILSLTEQGLKLEYQSRDGILGLFKSSIKSVLISLDEVVDIRFKKGWFGGGKLRIQLGSMEKLDGLPGHQSGMVVLHIKKEYREQAVNLVAELVYVAAEQSLKSMKEGFAEEV